MVSQAPVTHHTLSQSAPKVHSGFHAAWDLSGLKAAVTKLIADNIPAENAARMTVFLTGVCPYVCTHTHRGSLLVLWAGWACSRCSQTRSCEHSLEEQGIRVH